MIRRLAAIIALTTTAAQAQDCTPVQFNPGESGAFVDGVIAAEGRKCYTLDVRKGQNIHIGLVGGSQNIAISVIGVGDARQSFDFAAPANRVEFLVFQLMRSVTDADYSLLVKAQ